MLEPTYSTLLKTPSLLSLSGVLKTLKEPPSQTRARAPLAPQSRQDLVKPFVVTAERRRRSATVSTSDLLNLN